MSDKEFGSNAIKIGIVLTIIGGVLGVVDSVEGIASAISTSFVIDGLTFVLLSIAGFLVLCLSIALVWIAILLMRTPKRTYGLALIFCSSGAIALNLLLVFFLSALFFADSSITNSDQRLTSFSVQLAVNAIGDFVGFMALGLIGGILVVVGTVPKNVKESST